MESEIKALADAIYVDRVRRARAAPLSKKMGWGGELFTESCHRMRAGIRAQFPESDEAKVEEILRVRLRRLRQVHEHGIYIKAERPA